jgi:hypothetical protein
MKVEKGEDAHGDRGDVTSATFLFRVPGSLGEMVFF